MKMSLKAGGPVLAGRGGGLGRVAAAGGMRGGRGIGAGGGRGAAGRQGGVGASIFGESSSEDEAG